MTIYSWVTDNYIEIFGALAGIIYVILEVRQNIWLWPLGIVTSAVYIWVFFTGKLYADMSLQGYYLVISIIGWYWWAKGGRSKAEGRENEPEERKQLTVTRIKLKATLILSFIFLSLFAAMWFVLSNFTDSPVPVWDSFITSLSVVATWMLARKIYEHWYLWIIVNIASAVLFITRGLYPTVLLYIIYGIMSVVGLITWRKTVSR
jgi:nicotinamide mononucleotide transporter